MRLRDIETHPRLSRPCHEMNLNLKQKDRTICLVFQLQATNETTTHYNENITKSDNGWMDCTHASDTGCLSYWAAPEADVLAVSVCLEGSEVDSDSPSAAP